MLTFETLRRVLDEEKANQQRLTSLPEHFWQDVRAYLNAKSAVDDKEKQWEIESAKEIVQDIVEMREAKMLRLAAFYTRSGIVPENMAEHEKVVFNSLASALKEWRSAHQKLMEEQPDLMFVAILQDIPQFVDEVRTYGPFSSGDVVSLPTSIAQLLTEKGAARLIEKQAEVAEMEVGQ